MSANLCVLMVRRLVDSCAGDRTLSSIHHCSGNVAPLWKGMRS
ncbi:MAG: hypothetical protein AB8A42_01775 [Prochlorococcus sp.]